jgi:hypothetical protein
MKKSIKNYITNGIEYTLETGMRSGFVTVIYRENRMAVKTRTFNTTPISILLKAMDVELNKDGMAIVERK